MFKFDNVQPMSRESSLDALASEDPEKICNALVAVAMHECDWQWVQDICLRFLEHDNEDICALAATCLGHLARIHGHIDKDLVINAIHSKMLNEQIKGTLQDACDDIEMFAN